jgi:hypothetical protein
MKPNSPHAQSQYEKSGVYKLTCPDCQKKYIGQTAHLLENQHSVGPINGDMEVLYSYTTSKGKLMDTIKKLYVYIETRENNQINYKNTVKSNVIFDIISSQDPLQGAHWCPTKHLSRQVSHLPQVHPNTHNTAAIKIVSTTGICSLNIS